MGEARFHGGAVAPSSASALSAGWDPAGRSTRRLSALAVLSAIGFTITGIAKASMAAGILVAVYGGATGGVMWLKRGGSALSG